jgi:Tol biopolymer transport system component
MICRVDTQTGDIQTITESKPDENGKIIRMINSFDCSRDGRTLFYIAADESCRLIERNLETGHEKTVYSVPSPDRIFTLSRSPDGKWLAFTGSSGNTGPQNVGLRIIKIISVQGGEPRELLSYKPESGRIPWCAWTNDGKHVLFTKATVGSTELWRVPITEGKAQKLGSMKGGERMRPRSMWHLSVHPVEPSIAYVSSSSQEPEIWMMRNFLPGEKGKGGQK